MKTIITYLAVIIPLLTFAQVKKKDTLFIKYDSLFLKKFERMGENKAHYYIKSTGNNGTLLLEIDSTFQNLKSEKIECIEEVLKKSNAFYKEDKLDDYRLGNYLENFVIFIIENINYNLVKLVLEIE